MKVLDAAYRYYKDFGFRLTAKQIFHRLAGYAVEGFVILASHSIILRKWIFGYCVNAIPDDISKLFDDRKGTRIAIILIGGIGDSLFLSAMAVGIREKYPDARLFAFVRDLSQADIFLGCGLFTAFYGVRDRRLDFLRRILANEVDLSFENRYVVATKGKLVSRNESVKLKRKFAELNQNWELFPLENFRYGTLGKTIFELASATSGLAISNDNLFIPLHSGDFECLGRELHGLSPYRYITIHHGCDRRMVLPDGSGSKYQTKNWPLARWEKVVAQLQEEGFVVVQLGLSTEEMIPGALSLLGKLSIRETAAVLKYSQLHLDTEGGLVHLAKAVKTRSIVVFGPTPVSLFGYSENANLTAGTCHNCFWSDVRWFQRCPKGTNPAACMEMVTVQNVTDAAHRLLENARRKLPQAELVDLSCFDKTAIVNCQNTQSQHIDTEIFGHDNAINSKELLYVIDRLNSLTTTIAFAQILVVKSEVDSYLYHLMSFICKNFSASLHLVSLVMPDDKCSDKSLKAYQSKYDIRYGSTYNNVSNDESVDIVIILSFDSEPHCEFVLYEALRVLQHGGIVIATFGMQASTQSTDMEVLACAKIESLLSQMGIHSAGKPLFCAGEPSFGNTVDCVTSKSVGGFVLRKM